MLNSQIPNLQLSLHDPTAAAGSSRIGLIGLAPLVAVSLYAFHASPGGRPLFDRATLED